MFYILVKFYSTPQAYPCLRLFYSTHPARPHQVGKGNKVLTTIEKAIKTVSALHNSMAATVADPIKAMEKAIGKALKMGELNMYLVCETCLAPQVCRE